MFSALAGMALYLEKQQLCQHHGWCWHTRPNTQCRNSRIWQCFHSKLLQLEYVHDNHGFTQKLYFYCTHATTLEPNSMKWITDARPAIHMATQKHRNHNAHLYNPSNPKCWETGLVMILRTTVQHSDCKEPSNP
jgi:hypothetical protein